MDGTLRDFVKQRRLELGLTQAELAEKAGVGQPLISDIERGATKMPDADRRRRLARALGVSHVDLLVAGHEITPQELRAAGVEGVVERDPDDLRARLHAAIDGVPNWDAIRGLGKTLLQIVEAAAYDQTEHLPAPTEPAKPSATGSGPGR